MTERIGEAFIALRAPFPPATVGKLPRVTCRDCRDARGKVCEKHTKTQCRDCGNWMTSAHIHLDYVGHAACTDRLLSVDPFWTWEPVAWTADGLPCIREGAMWIRLTVLGVTRLGVGSADGKGGPDAVKEMIGDAIRNAAMRFGVALDLWSKEDLHAAAPEPMADDHAIAVLVGRMAALPADARRRCKGAFVAQFGLPQELRAAAHAEASQLVADFEAQSASEDSVQSGTGHVVGGLARDPEHAQGGDGEAFESPSEPPPPSSPRAKVTPARQRPERTVSGDGESATAPPDSAGDPTAPGSPARPTVGGGGAENGLAGASPPPPADKPMGPKDRAQLFALMAEWLPAFSDETPVEVGARRRAALIELSKDMGQPIGSRKDITARTAGKLIAWLQEAS